ncbi:response regulator [Duganella sp. FT135W]|uniref:Response regulator n=1 Tax=Duganella flavida TaxID=2692175 RepID=A0A6L8K1I5_9BURK|nr:response regulator [Duganella flavida]MYM21333.1 response regulator [Duganella flavida]
MEAAEDARHRKLRIFLVEDNQDTREVVAIILEGDGHQVHAVGSVQAALDEFSLSANDVLLTDLGLPDGSGLDLMRQLRDRGEAPYAIAMSGFGSAADRAASMAAGFRHHLVKPFDFDRLAHLLETIPLNKH